jgi:F420-0:gamma-glutamyl ligase
MHVITIRTPIIQPGDDYLEIIAQQLAAQGGLEERSVVVVASKIVATAEQRIVPKQSGDKAEKHALVRREADRYLEPHASKYDIMLTIKDNWMFVNAGIDESNVEDAYLLWPEAPQRAAAEIWEYLRDYFDIKELGVTLSDSKSFFLNWGVVGHAIAYCGFEPLRSYIGEQDLFGRTMRMSTSNVMQAVTTAAVLEMGEGAEQTPVGVVTDIKDITFQDHAPTQEELAALKIEIEDDVYAPLLTSVSWQRGESGGL